MNTAYLVGFRESSKLIIISGKFAAMSRRIWQTGRENFKKLLMTDELDKEDTTQEELVGLFQNEDVKNFGLFWENDHDLMDVMPQ